MADIDNIIKRLRNLPQYKNFSDEKLRKIAENKQNAPANLDVESLFTDKEEIKLAKALEAKYLEEYNLETISDKSLLRQLIYLEVFHIARLQKSANEFQSNNGAAPLQIVDALHKNINQIVSIKEKLGLTRDNEESLQTDAYKSLKLLMKKAKVWRENNQASRTLICAHCSKPLLLMIKTDAWEAHKHPFFKDRLLGNEHLIKLYQENKLSKLDIALILEVSEDYIDWLINKWSIVSTTGTNTLINSYPEGSPTEKSEDISGVSSTDKSVLP
jgi:hypothetical protein